MMVRMGNSVSEPRLGGSGANGRIGGATALIVMAGIAIAAALEGVRRIAYAALAALIVWGLWPLLLIVGGLAALMIVAVIAVSLGLVDHGAGSDTGLGGMGEGVVVGGSKLARIYYRFLGRVRHPIAWGAAAGALAGTALVWAILGLYVIPRERRTLDTLMQVRSALEDRYRQAGSYPSPTEDGTVPATLLSTGGPTRDAGPVADGFGRPVRYRLGGAWKIASYTVSSLGFDGRPSDDNLCVTGGTRLGHWLERAQGSLRQLVDLRSEVAAIETLRCSGAP